jgi:O-antigen ligase
MMNLTGLSLQEQHKNQADDSWLNFIATIYIGILFSIAFFFFNYSIQGVGFPIIIFGLLCILSLASVLIGNYSSTVHTVVLKVVILNFLVYMIMLISFLVNNSLTSIDTYYLISNSSNGIWFLLIYIFARHQRFLFQETFRFSFLLLAVMIIAVWCFLFLYVGDLFFMRTHVPDIGWIKHSLFRNPNKLSRISLCLLVVLAFIYNIYYRQRGTLVKSMYQILMFLISFIILSTLSRTNILGLFIFWFLFFCFGKKVRGALILLLVFTIISVGSLQIKSVRAKVSDAVRKIVLVKKLTAGLSVPPRTRTWAAAINIIGDYPWYGVGYSAAEDYLDEYGSYASMSRDETKVISLHGGFLKFAVYGGIFALALFIYLYKTLISIALKGYRSAPSYFQKCAGYHLLMLLIVLIPMNIAADNFGLAITWIFLFYLLTNAIAFPNEENSENQAAANVNAI